MHRIKCACCSWNKIIGGIKILNIAIAFTGTLIASYTDLKRGIIPDELNHAMIVIGILYIFFNNPLGIAFQYYLFAFIVFLIGLGVYFLGQLGGGDVKLFTALALLIPIYPEKPIFPFFNPVIPPYPFIVSLFFISAIFSVFYVSLNYMGKILNERKKIKDINSKIFRGLLICLIMVPIFILWAYINSKMLIIALPMLLGGFILAFKEDILKRYVVKEKIINALTDDDVIALELIPKNTKKKLGLNFRKTFLKSELVVLKEKAKKHKIKKILVAENLPQFGPFIFISLVLNLLLGDAFLWFLSL